MKRWKRELGEDDDTLTFDDLEEIDEDSDVKSRRRPYLPPRPIRTCFSYEDDDISVDEDDSRFDEIESKIRSGDYKPKKADPWNAHVLYSLLKSLGEI